MFHQLTRKDKRRKMITEFLARFFSNDSSDKFDNTLSSFTTEFDDIIDLSDGEWEMGVTHLFINPMSTLDNIRHMTRDIINLTTPAKNFTITEAADYFLEHALEKKIYNSAYFEPFTDKGFFFESKFMDKMFADSAANPTSTAEKTTVTIKVDVRDLLRQGENVKSILPHHKQQETLDDSIGVYTLNIPVKTHTTMKEFVFLLIRYLTLAMRAASKTDSRIDSHAQMFAKQSTYENTNVMNSKRIAHLHTVDDIAHRCVEKFAGAVQERSRPQLISISDNEISELAAKKKTKPTKDKKIEKEREFSPHRRFIMIYCDAITPQIVGPKRTRLIYMTPIDEYTRTHLKQEIVTNVHFFRLEKKKLKTISFLLLDEYGHQINFGSSYTSNCITVCFRKVKS